MSFLTGHHKTKRSLVLIDDTLSPSHNWLQFNKIKRPQPYLSLRGKHQFFQWVNNMRLNHSGLFFFLFKKMDLVIDMNFTKSMNLSTC